MTLDGSQFVIVHQGYGSYSAHPCTLANAQKLLESRISTLLEATSQVASNLAQTPCPVRYLGTRLLVRALEDIATQPEGFASTYLSRLLHGYPRNAEEAPEELVTRELKQELALWLMERGQGPQDIQGFSAYNLKENWAPASLRAALQERAGSKPVVLADSETLGAAEELLVLRKNAWKPTAKESSVVSRFLDFINRNLVDTSDERYHLATFEPEVS